MKAFLVFSQILCLFALVKTTPRPYKLTLLYLLGAIAATISFQTDCTWLTAWYAVLVGPVALLRLAAALEISHRQTEGFAYWPRLMASVWFLAAAFAGLAWMQVAYADTLQWVVVTRRLVQLFTGAIFLVLEAFWIPQSGWVMRRVDKIALAFGLIAMNHAVISTLCGVRRWNAWEWAGAQWWAWWVEGACYLVLTLWAILSAGAPQSSALISARVDFPAGDTHSLPEDRQ